MANYKVSFKKSVAKDLRIIPNGDVKRILARIDSLADEPRGHGCIKLAGQDRYRARVGLYRIVYEIQDQELVVLVIKVAHRASAYKSR